MSISEIFNQSGEHEENALKMHAILLALSKISRYEAECAHFEAKYNESLSSFRKRVQAVTDQEDFEADDDLMDWEFASRACQWWKSKLDAIGHVD